LDSDIHQGLDVFEIKHRLPPVELEEVHTIASQVMGLVSEFSGERIRNEILSASNPKMKLE
jgi:hypothetical protein